MLGYGLKKGDTALRKNAKYSSAILASAKLKLIVSKAHYFVILPD